METLIMVNQTGMKLQKWNWIKEDRKYIKFYVLGFLAARGFEIDGENRRLKPRGLNNG